MYLEAMHKSMMYCYLEGKKNKRVDKPTSALINVTYDNLFYQLAELCKGNPRTRIPRINKNHLAVLKVDVWDVLHSDEEGS